MRKINWTTTILLIVVGLFVLLVAGNLFSFGWSGTGNNWGMMGGRYHPGMMGGWGFSPFVWLFGLAGMFLSLGLLALLIMGVVWLVQQVTQARPSAGQNCANCGRAVQSDWQLCPHCGHALTQSTANTV